ncbi:MAG: hypothetical protein MZV70_63435 [Desulfobacterales bacterium]|nr:hypothetical protein [Desulfobacterales bacterium]
MSGSSQKPSTSGAGRLYAASSSRSERAGACTRLKALVARRRARLGEQRRQPRPAHHADPAQRRRQQLPVAKLFAHRRRGAHAAHPGPGEPGILVVEHLAEHQPPGAEPTRANCAAGSPTAITVGGRGCARRTRNAFARSASVARFSVSTAPGRRRSISLPTLAYAGVASLSSTTVLAGARRASDGAVGNAQAATTTAANTPSAAARHGAPVSPRP